jgi:hypothetical protein
MQTSLFSGPPVVNEMLGQNETELFFIGRATKSDVYSLRITSWNSTYSLTVQSVWSPYYFTFRYVIVAAVALMLASLVLHYYGRTVEKREGAIAGQARPTWKSRIISQVRITRLNHLEWRAKHALSGIYEYAQRLAAAGPYMIVAGLGGTILWGVSWLIIPSVSDSIAGMIVPLAILICFVGGIILSILGALAHIALEW